jgi:hypothetical protein
VRSHEGIDADDLALVEHTERAYAVPLDAILIRRAAGSR